MSYPCYQPSGQVPVRAYLLAALCFVLAPPLSILYAWLILQLPTFLTFLVCIALASALASAVKQVCAYGRVRNPRWAGWFGLLLAICICYFQWAAWTAFQIYNGDRGGMAAALSVATQPGMIASHPMAILASASGFDKFIWIACWLGEAWVLLFFPYFMGKMRAEEVFDEANGNWAVYTESPKNFKLVEQATILGLIYAPSGKLSDILDAETDPASPKFSRLRVYCRSDEGALLSIVTVERNENGGKERIIECSPGRYLRVKPAELDELLSDTSGGMTEESDPPELIKAIQLLQAGNLQAAFTAAQPFVQADDERLSCDANRICAIACSDSKQWPAALGYWKALFAKESTAHNALQVATSAVMANETEQGIEWAERARAMNSVSREMSEVAITTGMLTALSAASDLDAALPFLAQLRDCYTQLRVTDPTFLFGHRMPLFHVFLQKSGEIVDKVLGVDERREWYASMLPHLDERGQAELTCWLDGTQAQAQAS